MSEARAADSVAVAEDDAFTPEPPDASDTHASTAATLALHAAPSCDMSPSAARGLKQCRRDHGGAGGGAESGNREDQKLQCTARQTRSNQQQELCTHTKK